MTLPLESTHHSSSNPFYNVAFADDFTGCGKLESLKQWFGEICRLSSFQRILSQFHQDMAYK